MSAEGLVWICKERRARLEACVVDDSGGNWEKEPEQLEPKQQQSHIFVEVSMDGVNSRVPSTVSLRQSLQFSSL